MEKPPILRQRYGWQFWKLTLVPLAVGTAGYYAVDALTWWWFPDFLRVWVIGPAFNFLGLG